MGHPGYSAQPSLTERLRGIESEIAAGRAEGALPLCQDLATLYPRALAVQRVLGEIYLAMRRPREALAALDRALTGDPEDARACCARAIVHQMHGDQMAALAWYRRACDIRPEDASLRATYGEMAAALGQGPYQPGRAGLARLYMRGDLFAHAIREWESLIAENNDVSRLEAHAGLVETLWRANLPQDAELWARRTLTNAPSCLKPLLIAGVIAHDEGRDDAAEPFLSRAAGLDPDFRAARALFADRLAAGDTALATLLWGDTPPFDASSSTATGAPPAASGGRGTGGQRATQPAERRVNRPLVTGELAMPATRTTRTDLSAPAAPLPPPVPRPNDLPANFHSMFKETENMLWAPGESDPNTLRPDSAAIESAETAKTEAVGQLPSASPLASRPPLSAPGAGSGVIGVMGMDAATPPAIAESGFALGDTEMRRAIRWVQWLQAQGARAIGEEPQRAMPSGSLDALLNIAPGDSFAGSADASAPHAPPVTALPSIPSQPSGALPVEIVTPNRLPSGPLPPPSSADLRQMFAELDPGARDLDESRFVDGSVVETPEPGVAGAPVAPSGAFDAFAAPAAPEEPHLTPQRATTAGPLSDALPWPAGAAELGRSTGGPRTGPAGTPDATIEELARLESADGFTPFEIEPGKLAALAGEPDGDMDGDWLEASADDAGAMEPGEPAPPMPAPTLPAAPEPEPEPFSASSSGARDYVARLHQARGHRDSGELDAAIAEYRTVVRNAPDLLSEVLTDVESCLVAHPEHPELHRLLGDARIRQGEYMSAIEAYNRATALSQALDGQ